MYFRLMHFQVAHGKENGCDAMRMPHGKYKSKTPSTATHFRVCIGSRGEVDVAMVIAMMTGV